MKNIEEKLNNLPKVKLGQSTSNRIKFLLYKKAIEKRFEVVTKTIFVQHKAFAISMAILIMSIIILPSYAYASRSVTVGHILYPVKMMAETVEFKLSSNKAEKFLKFSLRRIEEAEAVASKERQENKIPALMNDAVNLKNKAIKHPKKANEESINNYKSEGYDTLIDVAMKVGVESSDEVLNAIALTLDSIKKNGFHEKIKPDSGKKVDKIIKKAATTEENGKTEVKNEVIKTPRESNKAEVPNEQAIKAEKSTKQKTKEKEIGYLKNEVKKLEIDLRDDNYKSEDVDKLVEKINNRIEKAEKEPDDNKSKDIIEPTKALTKNGKYFVEKEEKNKAKDKRKNKKNKKKDK